MHRPYSREYRKSILTLVGAGQKPNALARRFQVCEQTIRNWIKQESRRTSRPSSLTTSERTELRRVRREIERLRVRYDILKKAAAWFALERDFDL
jgi:transposase